MTTTPQAALLSNAELLELWITASNQVPHSDRYLHYGRAILAKLQPAQEPAQAGELPEPDAVFYCSEDTGYLTQYLRPPANLTDGDVAMYEADTVRSLLISAALAARKPLSVERIHEIGEAIADGSYGPVGGPMECYQFEPESLVEFVRAIESNGIGLEVKP